MSERWWAPIPARAVAVRYCVGGVGELDALEETVLGLLRNRPRTIDDLTSVLAVGDDLILSALLALSDRELSVAPSASEARWMASSGAELAGAELRDGYVLVAPHAGGRILGPIVRDLREGARSEQCLDPELTRGVEGPRLHWPDLNQKLAGAVARGALECPVEEGRKPGAEAPLASLVRVHPLDRGDRRGILSTVGWAAIDVLPGLAADVSLVFHEPTPFVDARRETPASPALADWVERSAPALRAELERRKRDLIVQRSIVLRAVGMDSPAKLEEVVVAHHEALSRRLERRVPPRWPDGANTAARAFEEASRWLLIARREPGYETTARRAHAGAAEVLLQSLWYSVRGELEGWSSRLGPPSKSERQALYGEEASLLRLDRLGLKSALGGSRSFLIQAVQDPKRLAGKIAGGEPGAGDALTLWLAPLLLLPMPQAQAWATTVHRALKSDELLFDHLDALIDARNAIVHERAVNEAHLSRRLEDLHVLLWRVASAIFVGDD